MCVCVEWEINFLLFMLEEPCSHLFFNFPSIMFIIIRCVSGLDKEERKNTHTHFDTFIHQTESVFLETDGAEWKMFGQHKILWQSRWAGRGPRCRLAATHTHIHTHIFKPHIICIITEKFTFISACLFFRHISSTLHATYWQENWVAVSAWCVQQANKNP